MPLTPDLEHRHRGIAGDGPKINPKDLDNLPIPVTAGGTGQTSLAANGVVIGEGTGGVNVTGPGTAGQFFGSNGSGNDPSFQNLPANSKAFSGGHAQITTSQTLDTTNTTGFTPSIIILFYEMAGCVNNGGLASTSAGIIFFSGTTPQGGLAIYDNMTGEAVALTGGANLATGNFTGTTPKLIGGNPSVGDGNANDIQAILSINSVSATGFVVREVYNAGTGNGFKSSISWKAIAYS